MDDLLPKMQQLLSEANSDKECQTSPNFLQVLQQNLVPAQTFTQSFLKTVLLALDTSESELSTIWLNMLLEAIAILPAQTVCCEILPTAIHKSQISEPINTRLIACRILGKMCSTFSLEMLRREAVPTVIALCQDVLWDVRAHICDELRTAGPLVAESTLLLMSLVDLTNDENCTVRAAAVNTVSGIVEHLRQEVMISVVTPLVLKLCKESDIEVLQAIAKNIGKLCICLQDHISESEKQSILSFYQKMTQIGLLTTPRSSTVICENLETSETHNMPDIIQQYQEIREQAALNFPLVTEFFLVKLKKGINDWFQSLYGIFRTLTMDPQYTVRVIVAKIFFQVLHIFGPAYYSSMPTDFMKLLSDKRIEVLKSLTPHLAQILLKLTGEEQKELQNQEDMGEIGQSLLLCENSLCGQLDWRIYCTFLEQLEVLPLCYTSDFIYTHFLDHLMKRLTTVRQLPCRLALSHIILVLLRYNISYKHCTDIRNRLCERLLICGNSYMRISYLHLCCQALEIFSRKYFKDNFFCNVLKLGDDRIANVRLSVAKLLPKLKILLVLPEDHDKLLQIQFLLTRLLNDKDRDVLSCAQDAKKQIETNKHNISSDVEDKYREQEEAKLQSSNDGKLFNTLSNDMRYKKFRITENHHYKMMSGSHGLKTTNEKSYTYNSIGEHDFIVDAGVCITSIPSRIPSPKPVAANKYWNCEMKICSQKEKRNSISKEMNCEIQLKERKKFSETFKNIKYHSNKSSLLQENSSSNENVNTHLSLMDVKNGNIPLGESHQSTEMQIINSLNFSSNPNDIVRSSETGKSSTSSSCSYKKESYILKEQTVPIVENTKYKPDSSICLRSSVKRLNLLDDKKGNAISKSKNASNLNTVTQLQSSNETPIVFRKTSDYKKKRNSFVGDFVNTGVGIPKKNIDYARKRFSLVETPLPIDPYNKSNSAEIRVDIDSGKSNSAIQSEKKNSIPKRTSQLVSKKSIIEKTLEPNCRKINNIILQGDRQASKKQNSVEASSERESRTNEIIGDHKVIDTHLETVIKSSNLKISDEKLLDQKLVPDVNIHGNSNDAQILQVSKREKKVNDGKIVNEHEHGSKKRYTRNSTLMSTYSIEVSKHPNTNGKTESKSFSKLSEITTNRSNKKRQSFIDCSQLTKSDCTKLQTDSKHRRHSSLERPKTIKPPSNQPPNSKLPVLRRQIHPTLL